MAHISGLVAAPSLFEYCDTHTHLMICLCFIHNRPLILEYGLWDEVRVDQGKEWVLSLFVQKQMAHLATNQHNKATSSTKHIQEGLC